MACRTGDVDSQPFPRRGALADRLNLSADDLREALSPSCAIVYCYIIATVEQRDDRFIQRGSGPNFQGGRISLCTCKHLMRTYKDPCDWEGAWIAGFTGVAAGRGSNALVYLMRVDHAFDSHAALWASGAIPTAVKRAKAAHRHPLGDIFEPKDAPGDPYRPRSYIPPHRDHVHRPHGGWHGDIDYVGPGGRRAALLFGGAATSFLWETPLLYHPVRLHRGQRKTDLATLRGQLTAEGPR